MAFEPASQLIQVSAKQKSWWFYIKYTVGSKAPKCENHLGDPVKFTTEEKYMPGRAR